MPESPIGVPANACGGDSGAHGTHVAGIVAAQLNGTGVVGVAPGVTLVPVQVCDGLVCWWSAAIDGITYAGDAKLDVINMSFYADDPETTSAVTDCDSEDSATVTAIDRAIAYARSRGVTPVAALGNNAENIAGPGFENCSVVPAESPGVIGVTALGPTSAIASYSNYGYGAADVAAPGGDGPETDSSQAILSTIPGAWASLNGTSMASPHAAGVAALIESSYGKPARRRRRHEARPGSVEAPGDRDRHRRQGIRPVLRLRPHRRAPRDRRLATSFSATSSFVEQARPKGRACVIPARAARTAASRSRLAAGHSDFES